MTHDPLCPQHGPEDCDLIARVRADERERIATALWATFDRLDGAAPCPPPPLPTVTTTTVSTDVRDTIYRGTRWGR